MPSEYELLVVDDDKAMADSIAEFFKNHGWSTTIAYSGDEALRLIEERFFDGLILDIRMPKPTGIDVLTHIHKKELGICVIILTGYANKTEDTVKAMKIGAWDYFLKENFDLDHIELSLEHGIAKLRLEHLLNILSEFGLHDLKNTLTAMGWGCELGQLSMVKFTTALDQFASSFGAFNQQARQLIEPLKENADNLHTICRMICQMIADGMEILHQMEDALVVQNGSIRLKKETIELQSFLSEVVQPYTILAKQQNITFQNTLILNAISTVVADRHYLKRVLNNLISNAIKHAQPSEIGISVRASGTSIEIAVCNNGCGVPEADRTKIFLKGITSGKGGKGLGLAFCKMVIEAHGGKIWHDHYPQTPSGCGSCFCFTLPN